MVILAPDQERVLAAAPDHVSADKVVMAANRRRTECEVDPGFARADNVIARDEIAVSLLDRDAVLAFEDVVLGHHVSIPWANDDAGRVSNAGVAPHLISIGLFQHEA